jgi:hypothetical protein
MNREKVAEGIKIMVQSDRDVDLHTCKPSVLLSRPPTENSI